MSEGRLRLRLAGEPVTLRVPVRAEETRAALPGLWVAVVSAAGAHGGGAPAAEAFGAQLAEALRREGHAPRTWRAALRARAGAERAETSGTEGVLRASAEALPAALDAWIEDAPTSAPTIALGLPWVALRRPRVAVLLTAGASPVHWEPEIRELRERFELVIPEPRPGLARALVRRLLVST
jgi:hypothetical protein